MKKVPFREFQQRGTKYLDNLPIALTRYGKVIAVVKAPESEDYMKERVNEPKESGKEPGKGPGKGPGKKPSKKPKSGKKSGKWVHSKIMGKDIFVEDK